MRERALARELLMDFVLPTMVTSHDDSTTIREASSARHGRAARPVLLIGSFISKTARVVSLDGPVTIGRGRAPAAGVRNQDTDVILHSDTALSRPHLRVVPGGDGWVVEDLDSTNGTFVDGRRVKKPTPLSDGSVILFGGHAGVFRRVSDSELAAIAA